MRHTQRPPEPLAGYARLSAVATLLLASAALAQPAGLRAFDLERLELNPNGQGSSLMGTGELLPEGSFRLSLAGQFENDPLVMYRNASRLGAVVSDRVTAHLMAAWAPLQWLEVGAQLPLVAWQDGDDLRAQGIAAPARTGLSTPTVYARLGLLAQRREAPVDLALEVGVGLPFGSKDALARDSGVRFAPKLAVGRNFGSLRAAVEAGVLLRPSAVLGDTGNVRDEVRLGAVLATTGASLRGELNVRGAIGLDDAEDSLEVLAGVRMPLSDSLEAFALLGPGFGEAPGTPAFRMLLGVAVGGEKKTEKKVEPAPRDDDADGVKNEDDACPTEAGPAERKGCPVKDADQDGVEDAADTCPTEAGPAERQGCPVKDTDQDGFVDEQDACPAEAGLAELRGCPAKDSDGDTVSDHLDNCPTEKGVATNAGCPAAQKQMVAIQADKVEIKEQVFFATGNAVIQKRSFALLDQVAKVLQQHPEVEKLSIEGHTDDRGNAENNRKLSLARAEAVKNHLVSRGVEASRLEAKGLGSDRPIAANTSPKGRATNRRVEFIIVPPELRR